MVQIDSSAERSGNITAGQGMMVQSLKEIKKSRRTVILGAGLNLPAGGDGVEQPLTPPLSDRGSDDVEELFSPESEEHYEALELSSDDEDQEWNNLDQHTTPIEDPEQAHLLRVCCD